jgi:hypothetical protein
MVWPETAFDGFSECGIDIGDEHQVGGLQDLAEIVGKRLGAGVAVRLEKHDDALRLERARGLQGGGELGRMVAVVVHDPVIRDRYFVSKRRLAPAKVESARATCGKLRAATIGQGDGCQRVEDVVVSGECRVRCRRGPHPFFMTVNAEEPLRSRTSVAV